MALPLRLVLHLGFLVYCNRVSSASVSPPETTPITTDYSVELDFLEINSYQNVTDWLKNLPELYSFVRLYMIGITAEGREILVVEINEENSDSSAGISSPRKPGVFVDAGTHAREYITVTAALAAIRDVIDNIQKNSSTNFGKVAWFFAPLSNPDGYEYVRTSEKSHMWRKNRSKSSSSCTGVDLNRNWDYSWGMSSITDKVRKPSSSFSWLFDTILNPSNTVRQLSLLNPCSELYAGTHAFSETESRAISQFVLQINNDSRVDLRATISLHSMSKNQMIVYPYGSTSTRVVNHDELDKIAGQMTKQTLLATGRRFQYGSISDIMYQATGSQADWMYGVAKINRTFVIELRDDYRKPPRFSIPGAVADFWICLTTLMANLG